MEKKSMCLNVLLAVVLGAGLLVGMILRAVQPNVVLADLEIPSMAALVLIALLIEYFTKGTQKRNWALQIVLAAITFAVLPLVAGLGVSVVKSAIAGAAVFGILTWIFDFAADRIDVTTDCKYAMVPTAFVMYLACQCFMGMFI